MKGKKKLIIPAAAVLALIAWFVIMNFIPHRPVYTAALPGLPAELEGFKIVQISDLHGASLGKDNSRLVNMVERSKPDAIAITGDILHSADQLETAEKLIKQLTPMAPVYYVTGNHEWASGQAANVKEAVARAGGIALSNEFVFLGSDSGGLVIAGCDDPNGYADQKTPQELIAEIKAVHPDSPIVMLYHRNHGLEKLSGAHAVLCGHGHGSPINAHSEIFRALLTGQRGEGNLIDWETYRSGMYDLGGMDICVSRGIGCSIIPLRVTWMHLPTLMLTTD
ncbi:MAG: metallophosphoesterase [Oscillospiraceae bacterium]|nr:metallophosphoesterase [Oscillospiraceae bacterium]